MVAALEGCGKMATPIEVSAWVEDLAREPLAERARLIEAVENEERRSSLPPAPALASAMAEVIAAAPAHRVEATVKMSTSALLAAPAPPPPTEAPYDAGTTAPLPEGAPIPSPAPPIAPRTHTGTIPLPPPAAIAAHMPTPPSAVIATTSIAPPSAPVPAPASPRHVGRAAFALVALVMVSGLVALLLLRGGAQTDPAPAAPVAPGSAAPAAPPTNTPPPKLAASAQSAPTATGKALSPAPPRPAPSNDGCNPPFFIDATGQKRYKRHCR
jgi:hypothetical protein